MRKCQSSDCGTFPRKFFKLKAKMKSQSSAPTGRLALTLLKDLWVREGQSQKALTLQGRVISSIKQWHYFWCLSSGNCWFLAAISSLTFNKGLMAQVVPLKQTFQDSRGIFHFRVEWSVNSRVSAAHSVQRLTLTPCSPPTPPSHSLSSGGLESGWMLSLMTTCQQSTIGWCRSTPKMKMSFGFLSWRKHMPSRKAVTRSSKQT